MSKLVKYENPPPLNDALFVYIGGPSSTGKTTLAEKLRKLCSFTVIDTDTVWFDIEKLYPTMPSAQLYKTALEHAAEQARALMKRRKPVIVVHHKTDLWQMIDPQFTILPRSKVRALALYRPIDEILEMNKRRKNKRPVAAIRKLWRSYFGRNGELNKRDGTVFEKVQLAAISKRK
jgi:cytidylate kinase